MVEVEMKEEENIEEKPKFDKNALIGDVLYGALKGLGLAALTSFANLRVEGAENIPYRGKAFLTTTSKDGNTVLFDMLILTQVSGRKIHFMVHPKIMANKMYGPILKQLGMIRGTRDKEDTEPIEKIFEILNVKGNLVGMTPFGNDEIKIKSMAAIIKFAIVGEAPIIPVAIYYENIKLFNLIPSKGIVVKVGSPIKVEKRLNREKYRDQRYELAEDIINIIDSLKAKPEV